MLQQTHTEAIMEIKEIIERHKLAITNLRKTHATAATSGAKRQITALIKRHERSIAAYERNIAALQ